MGPNVTDHVDYSSAIVPTGQEPAQAPHEIHCEPSITNTPPLSLIAPTGQAPAHEPQPIHESPITNAIIAVSYTHLTLPTNREV